jgi:hypothetical protein
MKGFAMQKMKLFVDTHDKRNGTFPQTIGKDAFADVYRNYAKACEEEGVVIVNTMVSAADGRMYCVNLAPNADAIRRAHEKIGLAFDAISEVTAAAPGDIYFNWK